jgi:hypothetical protein
MRVRTAGNDEVETVPLPYWWSMDGLPTFPCLPALPPVEEGDDAAGDPIVVATHPALPGDMHRRVCVRHGVAFTGEALRLTNHGSIWHAAESHVRESARPPCIGQALTDNIAE